MERFRNNPPPGSRMSGLFTFVLLISFALMALLIVLTGIRVYEKIEERAAATHGSRTTLMYIAGKVRAADSGSISIRDYENGTVLVITNSVGGEEYKTYIYENNGHLCEYFGNAERSFDPSFGQKIIPAESFAASWEKAGLLLVSVDGQPLHLYAQEGGTGG